MKVIITTLLFSGYLFTNSVVAAPTLTMSERYDAYLSNWVHSLAVCESGQNPSALNPQDGGSASIGYVQFKVGTFDWQSERLGLPYKGDDIWSKEAQMHVASEMIKDDSSNWEHWYNCHTKFGVDKPVSFEEFALSA